MEYAVYDADRNSIVSNADFLKRNIYLTFVYESFSQNIMIN